MALTRTLFVPLLGLVVAFGLAACGSDSNSGAPKTVVQTVTGGAPAQTSTSQAASTAPTEDAASTTSAPAEDDTFTMPNEVGKNLQAAQDHIQKVSGNPLFQTGSEDATGAGRFQVLDRNWTVCSQNVAPGKKVDGDTDITFSVVKDSETCP